MVIKLLAHASEHHETASEATKHAAEAGATLSSSLIFWSVLVAVPLVLFLVLRAIKAKLTTKLLLLSVFLIIFSIISYQEPGAYSVIALSVGFAIVLFQSIVGLSAQED